MPSRMGTPRSEPLESPVRTLVIAAREDLQVARETRLLLGLPGG